MADLDSTLVQWNINHLLRGGKHRGFSDEASEFTKCSFFIFRIAESLEMYQKKEKSPTKLEDKAWAAVQNKPALHRHDAIDCKTWAWGRARPLWSSLPSWACFPPCHLIPYVRWKDLLMETRVPFISWCSVWEQRAGSSSAFYWGQKFLSLIFSLFFFKGDRSGWCFHRHFLIYLLIKKETTH